MASGDALNCPVCRERFRSPKVLPSCGHTFCMRCLQDLISEERNSRIKCPLCRKEYRIPQSGVKGFPDNFSINRLLDEASLKGKAILCGQCSQSQCFPLEKCQHCDKTLCIECQIMHYSLMELDAIKALKSTMSKIPNENSLQRLEQDKATLVPVKKKLMTMKTAVVAEIDKLTEELSVKTELLSKIEKLEEEGTMMLKTIDTATNAPDTCQQFDDQLSQCRIAPDLRGIKIGIDALQTTLDQVRDIREAVKELMSVIAGDPLTRCLLEHECNELGDSSFLNQFSAVMWQDLRM